MQGVLVGFATILAVVAVGWLVAHLEVVGDSALEALSRLVFFVATPALMLRLLSGTDVGAVLSAPLLVAAASVVVTATLYLVVARWRWRHDRPRAVVGALSSSYVNAGNLGLPIAAYVLGDAALVAPVLLLQLLVITPLAFGVLDRPGRTDAVPWWRLVLTPLTNPITLGVLGGVLLSVTGLRLPLAVTEPLDLLGAMAVPGAVLAFGMSLRLGPRPMAGGTGAEVAVVTVLKLVVQPLTAWAVGRFALGLDGNALLAVVVLASLPTAQNIFVYATRYRAGQLIARDAIFVTTVLAVPVLLLVAALLA